MRKGVLVVLDSANRGGAERLVATTVSQLPRDRYEPVVVSLSPSNRLEAYQALDVPVVSIPVETRRDLYGAIRRLRTLIRRRNIRVVHTHLPVADFVGRLAAIGLARVVTTLHKGSEESVDGIPPRVQPPGWLDGLTRRRGVDHYLAVSDAVKLSVEAQLGLSGVETLPHFIDVHGFHEKVASVDRTVVRRSLGLDESDVVLLHVGRFTRDKAQAHLLTSFREAHLEDGRLRLLLAGEGPEMVSTRALAEELGLGDRVAFLEATPDVLSLYRAADMFVFPSRAQSFGIALLEAMAAGLPSVVTWVGGVREITSRETSLIVEVDHATELARAIIRLAKDPFLRQKMGRLAAVRAMAFDVSEWLPRLEAVYDSV